jgi:hypothetical protein
LSAALNSAYTIKCHSRLVASDKITPNRSRSQPWKSRGSSTGSSEKDGKGDEVKGGLFFLSKRPLLAVFGQSRRADAKTNPAQNAGFFHWQTFTYCRGSTLSNTRFASNELSSINC